MFNPLFSRGTVKSELKAANQQQALGIAILLLVLIISPIIIFLVRSGPIRGQYLGHVTSVDQSEANIKVM